MNFLTVRVLFGFAGRLAAVAVFLFIPAWSLDFWEAWVFMGVFFIPTLLTGIYFLGNNPEFVKRRLKSGPSAERRGRQKAIMLFLKLFFCLTLLVPGYDHRFKWSHVPAFLVITADAAILLGFLIQFRVFKENCFASAVIEIAADQKVISTGPYAVVRHPMYSGAVLVDLFIPVALGSWWGLPFAFAMVGMIILRLLDEEKFLRAGLPGYEVYWHKMKYRLIPRVW